MKPLVIFGTGELAECVHFYLSNDSVYKIVGFTMDRESIKNNIFKGLQVIPFDEVNKVFPPDQFEMFIAIGYQRLNSLRAQKYSEAKAKGYRLISYISSKASVWNDLQIGENCFITENNVLRPFVTLENNIFMWSGSMIGHHSYISNNCFISSHVVLGGGAKIKENCFLGINATVDQYVTVAKNCIIGANSLILNDTLEDGAYVKEATKVNRVSSKMLKYALNVRKRDSL
jgi:sugar O-acyltransferase (sialic acid O-acetyltransferase NeuD family)